MRVIARNSGTNSQVGTVLSAISPEHSQRSGGVR